MASKKELVSDQRFTRVTKDPRFWEMPERDRKIKIDKRFQSMFHDKKFKLKYTVDKRGRPLHHTSTEDLKRFYNLSDSESELPKSDDRLNRNRAKGERATSTGVRDAGKSPSVRLMGDSCPSVSEFGYSRNDNPKHKYKSKKNLQETELITSLKVKEDDSSDSHVNKSYLESKTSPNEESFELDELEGSGEAEEPSEWEESEDLEEKSHLGGDQEMREEESASDDEGETGDESGIDEDEDEDEETDSGPDLARGKGNVETSSEDEEENDLPEIFPRSPEVVHEWGELAKDAPRTDKITHRLAVCNMDWDRLKAKDLLALLNSFTPKGGVVLSVKIYPSEFGKERMKNEEVNGPTELLSLPEDVTEKDSIFKEKLRDYQFKRLKYFYAVVECDTPETANKIYEECDGLEFESSCSFVDLRFIPDDVTFGDEPKDSASEMAGAAYKPKYFTSVAVATSKVDITWDETDHDRVTSLSKAFKKDELLDMDFQAYLASSSEEEEEEQDDAAGHTEDHETHKYHRKDEEEQIAKYRELLQSIQEKEKKHQGSDMEMEIKWVPGLQEAAEEMVRNKLEGKDKLTPWEQFLEKKKDKRKQKKNQKVAAEATLREDECPSDVDLNDAYFAEELDKAGSKKKSKQLKERANVQEKEDTEKHKAELALLVEDEEEGERRHFSYNKIVEQQNLSKKKQLLLRKKEELLLPDNFQVNVADARFQALYTSHLFNLDPSDPNFKKTKAVEKILEEKARRRQTGFTESTKTRANLAERETAAKKSTDPALLMLIKSVKNKTEQFQARKKQKVK